MGLEGAFGLASVDLRPGLIDVVVPGVGATHQCGAGPNAHPHPRMGRHIGQGHTHPPKAAGIGARAMDGVGVVQRYLTGASLRPKQTATRSLSGSSAK